MKVTLRDERPAIKLKHKARGSFQTFETKKEVKMSISKSILALSILALNLVGCSTYQAPQIPASQMAHIKEFDTNGNGSVRLIHSCYVFPCFAIVYAV